jgi:hypothetical protein
MLVVGVICPAKLLKTRNMTEGSSLDESHFHMKLHLSHFYQIIAKRQVTLLLQGVSQAEIHDGHPDKLKVHAHIVRYMTKSHKTSTVHNPAAAKKV